MFDAFKKKSGSNPAQELADEFQALLKTSREERGALSAMLKASTGSTVRIRPSPRSRKRRTSLPSSSPPSMARLRSYRAVRRPEAFVREVFRTLKPGGRFAMTHIDPWAMPGWFVYRYFPEAFDLDRQDFVRGAASAPCVRA